jgi:hypothetical protein
MGPGLAQVEETALAAASMRSMILTMLDLLGCERIDGTGRYKGSSEAGGLPL